MLRNTLKTLMRNTKYKPVNYLVFDNGSNDNSAKMVKEEFSHILLIESPENIGFSRAVNQAFSECKTPLLAQINSDVLVHKKWLTPLVQCLNKHSDVALVGGRVLFPNGKTQFCGNIFSPTRMALSDWLFDPGEHYAEVSFHGPFFLVRNEAWSEVGGFDEGYSPGYSEDAEMGVALRLAGWRVVFVPQSRVTHLVSKTASLLGQKKIMRISEKHRLRFVFRNYPFSWLVMHMGLEWIKMVNAIYRGYLPQYIKAWRELYQQFDEISVRRKIIRQNPQYRKIFPSLFKMVIRDLRLNIEYKDIFFEESKKSK
jgi:GT2 family glycosyltransferase